MQAALTPRYGAPGVLQLADVPRPEPGPDEVLVQVEAAAVTAGDRRLRAADFPSLAIVLGRLYAGLRRPRHPVQGTSFAGRVIAVGAQVRRFAVGDAVFGGVDHGAYAEVLSVKADAAIAHRPATLSAEEAAPLAYSAVTALRFLRHEAQVQPGQSVLILGASGGVGRMAVQVAAHLGADVTGVCSAQRADAVRALGATRVLDYAQDALAESDERYDVVLDVAGASTARQMRRHLRPRGHYLTLILSLSILWHMLASRLLPWRKQRATLAVAMPSAEALDEAAALFAAGALAPDPVASFPLGQIQQAHTHAEAHRHEAVVVTMGGAPGAG